MDDIPNEIVLKVLNRLEPSDLIISLNVCKRFREMIISSSKLMRKLPLTLNKNWFNKIEFATEFGEYLKELRMNYCAFDSFEEFKSIINLFPKIEILKINYIYIKQPPFELTQRTSQQTPEDREEYEDISFNNLRCLEISSKFWGYITQVDGKILKHLSCDKIEHLKIHLPMQKISTDFVDFLCKQKKLKSLQVYDDFIDSFVFDDFIDSFTYNDFISSLFEIDLSTRVSFQLKKLAIHYRGDHRENFQKFLNSQSDLEELDIRKYDDNFSKFKLKFELIRHFRVRKLSLPLELIPSNFLADVEQFVNPNVQELTLMGVNNDPVLFDLLMKLFPNLKFLRLEYLLEFPGNSLVEVPLLESLIVDHFKIESLMNIKIKKLKYLEIGCLYPFVYTDWEFIITSNPTIEQLLINEISHFNTMTAIKKSCNILMKDLKKLKYLKVVQNDSSDCIKIFADIDKKTLQLSTYAQKMCMENLLSHYTFDVINVLY
ncbi:unnamed protein product [Diamesa serratosioi]